MMKIFKTSIMKKTLPFVGLCVALCFSACNSSESVDVASMKEELDTLRRMSKIVEEKDSALNEFVKAINEIEFNLATIKAKEGIIDINQKEVASSKKEQINNDVLMIYELLGKSRAKLDDMHRQMQRSNIRISELEKLVGSLHDRLTESNSMVDDLRGQLANKNLLIDTLFNNIDNLYFENGVKDEIIDYQRQQLNKAYYIIGTKDDLTENEVIDSKGGFVGMKRIKQLRQDFNRDNFTEIDITQQSSFILASRKAEILTSHPSNSYKIYGEGRADSLVITDIENFWSVSKYLVIVVE